MFLARTSFTNPKKSNSKERMLHISWWGGRNEVLKKRSGYDHSGVIESRYERRIPNTCDILVSYGEIMFPV